MARENNFLIGNGEVLTKSVNIFSGNGTKKSPYTLSEARDKLSDQLSDAQDFYCRLSEKAKPKKQVVAKLTLHPRFITRTDYPKDLLDSLGLRSIGSKSEKISPQKWGVEKIPKSAVTESYFIAGFESNFDKWADLLNNDDLSTPLDEILTIEKLSALTGHEKLKGIFDENQHIFEVVLHNDHDSDMVDLFIDYVDDIAGEIYLNKIRSVDGLTFIPIVAESREIIEKISDFTFVRVARGMPTLRPFNPMVRGADLSGSSLILPATHQVVDSSIKSVIFDGGLNNPEFLSNWVNYIEPKGIGKPLTRYLDHGLAVTGAFLFGQIDSNKPLTMPVSKVDHVRVLDEDSGKYDYETIDVLDRINEHLTNNNYDLVNISLGPDIAVEDDDITLWTATLDKIFAKGNCVATVAVGNNGQRDALSGLNRIQVPSDAVNVLSVGASDRSEGKWSRAKYSAFGPGRCPGRTKPDFLAFGGSSEQPFEVLTQISSGLGISGSYGTSFAAPLALRSIAGLRSILGGGVSHLSLRGLMIHHAERLNFKLSEVGWGKAELEPLQLITSEDNEATVLYQGELLVGEHLRIPLPFQNLTLTGNVNIKATLVISPEVDIEFPGAYTRHGVEVVFRPLDTKFNYNKVTGKKSEHPQSRPFFTKSDMFKSEDYINRDEGNKWEPTLKYEESFKANKLSNPVFDVYYHYRESAKEAKDQKPIPYALAITIRAEEVLDLYNQVIRNYASILMPYKAQNRIQLSV